MVLCRVSIGAERYRVGMTQHSMELAPPFGAVVTYGICNHLR